MADLGKVSIVPRGVYNSNVKNYETLDLVRYNNGAYIVLRDSPTVAPIDDMINWMLLVQGVV